MADLAELEKRVEALEVRHHGSQEKVDEAMRRARLAVEDAAIYSACWKFVPEPYYAWPLSKRAECLGATSVHNLCKSLLLDNKKAPDSAQFDPTYPKHVLVVLPYAASLDNKLLANAIRALRPVKDRLEDNSFDFRIASQNDNDRLTGYKHNSVTPFGIADPNHVLIILAEAAASQKFIWMGGGHVQLKLGMAVSDFCRVLKPVVAPISQPRADFDFSNDDGAI
ncbi:hypothetical protein FisN_2Lh262 [Fistulifera solaris]|uniref:YbaK/aminoacyl-tRNA synthetase-associated domain-containing protein n=1 Tax=Fistulifera solaris TaxID=1519565 RepID=A0A1Z5KFB6_FISSO|nr:hypothetical protein FisN_2Lh262 [Fistulifera solaris]|eukprot:GAX24983.1 hypothetical protein FisN_2Lh262 [Fistulifera solaris]